MIHRVEFRSCAGQKPDFNAEINSQLLALFCRVRCAAILKQDDMPTASVSPDQLQEVLMRDLIPGLSDEEQDIATPDIDHAMQNALAAIAGDWDQSLLPNPAITTIKRRGLGNDHLIKHQDDASFFATQASFQPPFA